MTEPLIDRDSVVRAVQSGVPTGSVGHVQPITDAVLDYLRSVLTPEALRPVEKYAYGAYSIPYAASGEDIHRRIFGEDE